MLDLFEKITIVFANNLIKYNHHLKEKSKQPINALDKSITFVFIKFNAKGIVESIEPDTNRKERFENVNEISSDNNTNQKKIKDLIRENQELRDALIETTKFESAYSLSKKPIFPKKVLMSY